MMPKQQKRRERIFKCDFPKCGKTYKHRSSLVRHSRTHASRRSRYNAKSPAISPPKEDTSEIEDIDELVSPIGTPNSDSPSGSDKFGTETRMEEDIPWTDVFNFSNSLAETHFFPKFQIHFGLEPEATLPKKQTNYLYRDILPTQLRLLLVCKGDVEELLECRLQTVAEDDLANQKRSYQALSYAWGKSNNKHEIFLSDLSHTDTEPLQVFHSVPRRFYIQPNLSKALKQIRSATKDLWFWIDAVCIDQDNVIEKSQQLAKMLNIYAKATNVCIWLGESDHFGQLGMQFVASVINLKLFNRMISGALSDEKMFESWLAFANLLRRHWFSRRWVIQEVAAARSASIHCGNICINWIDFADAVELFVSKLNLIRLQYEDSKLSKKHPDGLRNIDSFGAKAVVGVTNDVLRKTEGGDVLERLYCIESLVMKFQHFDVSDPRDTIYALLPLANDGHQSTKDIGMALPHPSLVPDYTKPALQVYIEFTRHCVLSSGSLDIICRHWALPLKESSHKQCSDMPESRSVKPASVSTPFEFPSWIGLVADSPFGPPSLFTGRINGDSLVGEPGHRIYNASGGHLVSASFGEVNESAESSAGLFEGTLYASGVIIGTVSRASSRVVDGAISDESLAIAGWSNDDDIDDIPDRVWKTLVADRTSDGKKAPLWYRRACIYCLRNTSPEGDLNTSLLITNAALPDTVVEFLKRVQAVVWSRKFLICHDLNDNAKRLYGLGSRYTDVGDLICVFFGCTVPVILRKHKNGYYEFIGECYIYGKMDGEAFAGLNKDTVASAVVEFNIR